jgi:hypothetical protein
MRSLKRTLLTFIAMAAFAGLLACSSSPPPPPPSPAEVRSPRPARHAKWVAGHWKWVGKQQRHVWVPGHWVVH